MVGSLSHLHSVARLIVISADLRDHYIAATQDGKITQWHSFFALGGDSLAGVELCLKIEQRYRVSVTLEQLFDLSLSELAKRIERESKSIRILAVNKIIPAIRCTQFALKHLSIIP